MNKYEDISVALPPGGLDPIHDILVELDPADSDKTYSQEELVAVWLSLDRLTRLDAHKWGVGDTEVRDEIFEFLRKQRAK